MINLARVTEIIKIEPFKITCRWTTGEILVNDFKDDFKKWGKTNNKNLLKLKNYTNFKNVNLKDGTLQWNSILISFRGLDGKKQKQALDIDPDTLYKQSKSISLYKLVLNEFQPLSLK